MAQGNPQKVISRALSQLAATKDPRRRLRIARAIQDSAQMLEHQLVAEAREAGATWTEIGAAYDMSKQAAQQRFRSVRRTKR